MVIMKKQTFPLSYVLFVAALCFSWSGTSLYAFMAFSFRMYAKIHKPFSLDWQCLIQSFCPGECVWHSCFQVYINLLDLWPSIVMAFYINFLITVDSIVLYHVHTKKYAINSTCTMIYMFIIFEGIAMVCDSSIVMSVRLG